MRLARIEASRRCPLLPDPRDQADVRTSSRQSYALDGQQACRWKGWVLLIEDLHARLAVRPLRHTGAEYRSAQEIVVEGVAMLWIVIPVVVLVVGGLIAFLLAPTIKTFFGPGFEPSPKDDASVENAIMNRMVSGGQ